MKAALTILISFLFLLCGAIRLARFNVQLTGFEKENFVGLPIPAAAVTLASYIIFSEKVWERFKVSEFSISLVVALSFLMVSTLEYDTFPKFTFDSPWNTFKLIFFVVAVVLIIPLADEILFPVCLLYVISGLVRWVFRLVSDSEVAENV